MRLNKIFNYQRDKWGIFIGYVLVGFLGLIVDFGVFYILINHGSGQMVTQWSAALAGFIHNHFWHHYKVFKHNQKLPKTTFYSLIISIFSIIISGPLLVFLDDFIGKIWLSKILILVLTTIILFFVRDKFIFKYEKSGQ